MDVTTITNLLLIKGVDPNYINKMKNTLVKNLKDFNRYYYTLSPSETRLVPLSKVTSLGGRGNEINLISWFDHITLTHTENIAANRVEDGYRYLQAQSLKDFHHFYSEDSCVKLIHYVEDDEYAVYGDGTHRTLWAKVSNAPFIQASVYESHKNEEAYYIFKMLPLIKSDLEDYLERNNLVLISKDSYSDDELVEIKYKGEFLLWFNLHYQILIKDYSLIDYNVAELQISISKLKEKNEIIQKQKNIYLKWMNTIPLLKPSIFLKILGFHINRKYNYNSSKRIAYRILQVDLKLE